MASLIYNNNPGSSSMYLKSQHGETSREKRILGVSWAVSKNDSISSGFNGKPCLSHILKKERWRIPTGAHHCTCIPTNTTSAPEWPVSVERMLALAAGRCESNSQWEKVMLSHTGMGAIQKKDGWVTVTACKDSTKEVPQMSKNQIAIAARIPLLVSYSGWSGGDMTATTYRDVCTPVFMKH